MELQCRRIRRTNGRMFSGVVTVALKRLIAAVQTDKKEIQLLVDEELRYVRAYCIWACCRARGFPIIYKLMLVFV